MNAIHRYGRPIELLDCQPAETGIDWDGDTLILRPLDDMRREIAAHAFSRDVERGVANTDQYQLMSSTFRYDPAVGGVVVDYPF